MTLRIAFLAALISLFGNLYATPTEDGLYAVFNTNQGEFIAELYYREAPISCANLIGLAEGTLPHYQNGSSEPIYSNFYDNLTFHRIVSGFVIQGGDPAGNGTGGPGYQWPDEVRPDLPHDSEGILSMANAGVNTNGSQFFITLASTQNLNGKHNVFGKIVEGIETVRAIGNLPTNNQDAPTSTVIINSIRALRIGSEAEAFDPTFYADLFNPNGLQTQQPIETELLFDKSTPGALTVSTPYQPFTDYNISISEDLENWSVQERVLPSLDPSLQSVDYQIVPSADASPSFVRIASSKGPLIDLASRISEIKIESTSAGQAYVETITIGANLSGTYESPLIAETSIAYQWVEIGPNRSQLVVQFPSNARIAFYLEKAETNSGPVYLRDGDFVTQGTYTITPPPET